MGAWKQGWGVLLLSVSIRVGHWGGRELSFLPTAFPSIPISRSSYRNVYLLYSHNYLRPHRAYPNLASFSRLEG